jgi:hypothetical protein
VQLGVPPPGDKVHAAVLRRGGAGAVGEGKAVVVLEDCGFGSWFCFCFCVCPLGGGVGVVVGVGGFTVAAVAAQEGADVIWDEVSS